jgi:acyl transferase domain-containing protein
LDSPIKRALAEVRELRERLERSERRQAEPIAIVGMGCRFPGGVEDTESYWRLLENGRDAITTIPTGRWDAEAYYDPNPDAPGKMTTRWGGFLSDIDRFDAEFFGIAAREAGSLDPQQRMLLEVSWAALEDAGIDPATLLGSSTGVFAGISAFDYAQLQLQRNDPSKIDAYFATGGSHSVAAGRISYVLGLKGPCVAVDTACSASLVAVHLACQSLRTGECDLALTGGVSVLLLPELFVDFSNARMMAADGRCKSFDAAADGYVRGEGCGMVVLKRLADATASGDRILGLIRGSAVNHDGRSSGLTAPNGPSQVDVIRKALAQADLPAGRVGYVEAHGTGTSLGDPIEVQALAAALAAERGAERPLLIGSVKTNFGHLEAAAGIAGLIKAVLCLRRGAVPKSLHFRTPNPLIPWQRLAVKVATELTPWNDAETRVAGVSSFGFSGTNAHVVLEEHRAVASAAAAGGDWPVQVVASSGRNAAALAANAARLARALTAPNAPPLADIAHSLGVGRSHFPHRLAVVGRTREEIADGLVAGGSEARTEMIFGGVTDGSPAVCMLFSGQGSQYAGMAKALYDAQPTFRRSFSECDEVLAPLVGRGLADVVYSADAEALLRRTAFAQPAIVALQCSMVALWQSWGVKPAAVIGHSLGEYSAAIAAGVLSLEDGLRLVARRAALVEERCSEGRMLALRATEAATADFAAEAGGGLTIAALNGPESVVVAGSVSAVERFAALLAKRSIQHRLLDTSRAFHHALLEPALAELTAFAGTLAHRSPQIPIVSTLTGELFGEGRGPDAAYWARQAREPVRFRAGLAAARAHGFATFLEVGATGTLTTLVRESDPDLAAGRAHASLRRGGDDREEIMRSVAALYAGGATIDWRALYADRPRRKVAVPGYAFQRKPYWYAGGASAPPAPSPADPLAIWRHAVRAAARQADHVPIDLALATYAQRWTILDALTTEYILRSLQDLALFRAPGERRSVAAIAAVAGVLPLYEALVARWLGRLESKGLLRRDGADFLAVAPLREAAIEPALAAARAAFADAPFVVDYLSSCGDQLTAILVGKQSPLETLFPSGSMQTAVNLYRNWSLSRYFNDIAAAAVAAIAPQLPDGEPLRVLEIGAGTGGTTAALLPELPAKRTQYRFTDVSGFFFAAAAKDFAAFPFVEYGVLDIEQSPERQGYGRHSFDAVVAANVLHATRDLGRTLDHVSSLLRPGGVLVLYEVTDPQSWIDTSVALIAGWATSTDGVRDDGPLLSAETWRKLLCAHGFDEVAVFPDANSPAAVLGMSVIVARVPTEAAGEVVAPNALERVGSGTRSEVQAPKVLAALAAALPTERHDVLVTFVREHVEGVLRRDATQDPIGRRQNLMELGLDSLMAIDLRNRLTNGLALPKALPVSLMFDYPNVEAIAHYLATLLEMGSPHAVDEPVPATVDAAADRARAVEDLSDEEIEVMLLAKLQGRPT